MSRPNESLLITGGLGYLGGRITDHILTTAPGFKIRLMTRRKQTQLPLWASDLDVVNGDLLDQASLNTALEGISTVIHLAAPNEIESLESPSLALEVNGQGTYQLLESCRDQGIKRFIYLSTFHVYGNSLQQPITESTPTNPIHPYAITHRLAEDLVNWYRHSYGLETLIFRLSNGYGYPMDSQITRWTLVFNDMCRQVVKTGQIRINSSGTQHRDFVSLSDIARGTTHFLDLPYGKWEDGLFNFGGQCSLSILEVAERIASEYQKWCGLEAQIVPTASNSPQTSNPVNYNINKLLQTGFSLAGNMSKEIVQTFELCKGLESIPK